MRKASLLAAAVALLALVPAGADPGLVFDQQAQTVARAYMKAWAESDRETLRRLSPKRPENKFGPPLFRALPTLTRPRVDAHRAAVDFSGQLVDAGLPATGMVTLNRVDEEPPAYRWKVRQVLCLDEDSRVSSEPKRSVTKADAAQEAQVLRAAQAYLTAWLKRDYAAMERLYFDRLTRRSNARSYFRLRSVQFTPQPAGHEIKVNFVAKVTVVRVLPKTVDGTFYMLKEDGQWKVRGTTLAL